METTNRECSFASLKKNKKKCIVIVLIIIILILVGILGYLEFIKKDQPLEIIIEEEDKWEKVLGSTTASSDEEIEISEETLEKTNSSSNKKIEISEETLEKTNSSSDVIKK